MTLEELLRYGSNELRDNGYVHGDRETAEFLKYLLGQDTAWIISHGEETVSADLSEQFNQMVSERIKGKPLSYIIGSQNFMGWTLLADERALIPRPETEQLTEQLVRYIKKEKLSAGRFLEIGTGSGAISIALKKFFPDSQVTATDVSEEALELAEENAKRLKVDINFLQSDLFQNVDKEPYDVVVANLPYVPTEKLDFVSDQILDWEPMIAIEAGSDGLQFIRPFLSKLPEYLSKTGIAAIEMWHTHSQEVKGLAKNFPDHEIVIEKDAADFDRFAFFLPIVTGP